MSLQIRDHIMPEIARQARRIQNRKPILQAMGAELVSITKRAFNDSSLRAAPWAPKKDGTPATLRKSGDLWLSINVAEVTNDSVTAASPKKYAAIHQFGGKTGKVTMPARPFFPLLDGKLTEEARRRIAAVAKAKTLALLR